MKSVNFERQSLDKRLASFPNFLTGMGELFGLLLERLDYGFNSDAI
jgi:hypothetical protein